MALPVSILVEATLDSPFYWSCIDAYRGLESFAVRVGTEKEDDHTSAEALGVLPHLLDEMMALTYCGILSICGAARSCLSASKLDTSKQKSSAGVTYDT